MAKVIMGIIKPTLGSMSQLMSLGLSEKEAEEKILEGFLKIVADVGTAPRTPQ